VLGASGVAEIGRPIFKTATEVYVQNRERVVYTVTDLGPGDGGKGGVVHKLCLTSRAHTVVKVGGAQGSHGVRTSRGEHFNFSQFGCGTFEGVRTHISTRFVADPNALLNEGELLRNAWQMRDAYDLLTVDERVLCTTPFHRAASQLKELALKGKPRGTIGTGVGEAFLDAELHPELAIRVSDIPKLNLLDRLEAVREHKLAQLAPVIAGGFWDADRAEADEQIARLHDSGLSAWTAERFREMAAKVHIVDGGHLGEKILSKDGAVVVESSHGVLTDRYAGFHPHTSKLRTLPRFTHEMLRESGYGGRVVNVGVTRAYQIRHGAGPMVTEDASMLDSLLPGSNKEENRYQGKVRVGPLDFVSLRYALDACGGPSACDALALTWFDQVQHNGVWKVCEHYHVGAGQETTLPIFHGEDEVRLRRQRGLGAGMGHCKPGITEYTVGDPTSREDWCALAREVVQDALRLPVRMISFGPTEVDKVLL